MEASSAATQEMLLKKSVSEEAASPGGKMEGILRAVLGDAKLGESWTCGRRREDQGKQVRPVRGAFAAPKKTSAGREASAGTNLGEASGGPQASSGSRERLGERGPRIGMGHGRA